MPAGKYAKGGAVGELGGRGPRRILGCDYEGGSIMDGGRELRREAARWRVVDAKQPGGCSAGRDGLVGLRTAGTDVWRGLVVLA